VERLGSQDEDAKVAPLRRSPGGAPRLPDYVQYVVRVGGLGRLLIPSGVGSLVILATRVGLLIILFAFSSLIFNLVATVLFAGVLFHGYREFNPSARAASAERLAGDGPAALATEVAYLRLGELRVASIPGEIYPEIIYGEYRKEPEAGVDFPDAPLERPINKIIPGTKKMFLGLANDEFGASLKPQTCWHQGGQLRSR